jgi:glycine cleavage system H protein
VRVGITDYAQDELGTVVYVGLPKPGTHVEAASAFGEIESTKTVSDLIALLFGTVVARNDALAEDPELVNRDPYGEGWLVLIEPDDLGQLDGLLTPEQYRQRTEAT